MPRIPEWLKLPFQEAIDYQSQKIALPAESIEQLMAEYHDFAFVVSGLTRADLTSDMQWLIEKAIEEGMTIEDFKKQFDRSIGRKGWQPTGDKNRRLYTILDTNVRRSQAAGKIKQMRQPGMLQRRPYWMWVWRDSVQPRPHHQALNGKVFLANHKFWDIAFPSCGYGCRCSVFALSESDLARMGKRVEDPPDPNTIADPGFRRASGTSPMSERKQILQDGLKRQSPQIQEAVKTELKKQGINV